MNLSLDAGCQICSAALGHKSHAVEMTKKGGPIDEFCEYVRDILLSFHLLYLEVTRPDTVLHPQVRCRKMPDFPQPSSSCYADGRSGV